MSCYIMFQSLARRLIKSTDLLQVRLRQHGAFTSADRLHLSSHYYRLLSLFPMKNIETMPDCLVINC